MKVRRHSLNVRSVGTALILSAATSALAVAQSPSRPAALAESTIVSTQPAIAAQSHTSRPQLASVALPLQFEKNQGQSAGVVKFLARCDGYAFFLTSEGSILRLTKPVASTGRSPAAGSAVVLQTQLVGAHHQAEVIAEDELPGHANYLVGNDTSRWLHDIPEYGQVRYRDVYDGIDVVYHGTNRQLEYDFIVSPGANSGDIHLSYSGMQSASIDANGDLRLHNDSQDLIEHRPDIYQMHDGRREPVAGGFRIVRQNAQSTEIAFDVADYDRTQPLIIDPVLVYATHLGGTGTTPQQFGDTATGVAVDGTGAMYVTGTTDSSDFPITSGSFQTQLPGKISTYISKLSPDGSHLIYSTFLGGSFQDFTTGIAVNTAGEAYVTGTTTSSNFPTTAGAFQTQLNSSQSPFIARLSADGSHLIYSTLLGGNNTDQGGGIAVDASGAAYVTGTAYSLNFPTTPGAFQTTMTGHFNAFVTKLKPDGSGLLYSTYLGGGGAMGYGIAVDSSGAAYAVGVAWPNSNFPTTPGSFQPNPENGNDAFVSKLTPDGSSLVYSSYLGGGGTSAAAVAVDASGSAYVTGTTSGAVPVTPGAAQISPGAFFGVANAFVSKVSADGSSLMYSTYLGGSGGDGGTGIAVNQAGEAYVAGVAGSTDFPVTANAIQSKPLGGGEAFITKIPYDGKGLAWSTYLGGSSYDEGAGIALDSTGAVYITGDTSSSDYPTTLGAFQKNLVGVGSGYVAKVVDDVVTVSPGLMNFGTVPSNTLSQTQVILVYNNSDNPLTISSVTADNPVFKYSTICVGTLAPHTTCNINVTYKSGAIGPAVHGTVSIATSSGVLQTSMVAQSVANPGLIVSKSALGFGKQAVRTTSAVRAVTLTSTGTTALAVFDISVTEPSFAQTNNCPANLAPGAKCVIQVTFTPPNRGKFVEQLIIQTNAPNEPSAVVLSGTGVAAP